MKNVKKYIYKQVANHQLDKNEAKKFILELKNSEVDSDKDIAIIGMSGRFPNAENLKIYWENISSGKNCIGEIPKERIADTETYLKRFYYKELVEAGVIKEDGHLDLKYNIRGYLKEIDKFDPNFFNISPREAKSMDPCQRLFLEEAYLALEDAGYVFDSLNGSKTGVFVGMDHVAELKYKEIAADDPMVVTGTWPGILASRISYVLNLKGPSMVIDTACSSGLVSVHEACKAINTGECTMAVAGGISSLYYKPTTFKNEYKELETIESSINKVKTFDNEADGTVWGEGLGVVILKKLKDALADGDPIHAVIKGTSINNDGASNGITAPDVEMQKELLLNAWKNSNVEPETISYIEAHGTGTKLGDPIEIKAITEAFKSVTDKNQFCGIGTVKSNIGHIVAASGIASLIKVVLMLKNRKIPPTINFSRPNNFINFINSPIYIVDKYQEWVKEEPIRAGISSFGFSGTNCHVVLEEVSKDNLANSPEDNKTTNVFTISAKSKNSLLELIERYKNFFNSEKGDFIDICYTSNVGRGHYDYRIALIVDDYEDLIRKINIISNGNLNAVEEGIYYGKNKTVSYRKVNRKDGEITELERRKFNNLTDSLVLELTEDNRRITIEKLCSLYVKGAKVAWNYLYKKSKRKRLNLPVYPFEKVRCWFEEENKENNEIENIKKKDYKNIEHPLIDRCLVESMYEDIYETRFNVNKQWILKEHKILNNHVLPGTAYLEMASKVCKKYFKGSFEIKDTIFYAPLIIEQNEEKVVQTILRKKENYIEVTIAGKIDSNKKNGEWTKYCECKMFEINPKDISEKVYDIDEIKKKLDNESSENGLINLNRKGSQINLGDRWNNDQIIALGENKILVKLNLSDELARDIDLFTLHTALFDNSVNAVSQKIGDGLYIPFYFKSIKVYKSLGKKLYSYIRIKNTVKKELETVPFEVTILDEYGNVVAEVDDYSTKKVNKTEKEFKYSYIKNKQYYKMKWVNSELVEKKGTQLDGTFVVFDNESSLSKELIDNISKNAAEVIKIKSGVKYKKHNENIYEVGCSEYDYNKLFKELKEKNITSIIHMFTISNTKVRSIDDLRKAQEEGIDSLFYITKSLLTNKYNYDINIVLLTNYANEVTNEEVIINPINAAFSGLGVVVKKEYCNYMCRTIDIDDYVTKEDIIKELKYIEPFNKIAYRNGKRHVQEFAESDCEENNNINIRENGVYIVTGGIGGLGLEISKYLASKNRTKIVLISRTQIPQRDEWDNILLGEENRITRAIKCINEIEALGSVVINIKANVCNEKEVNSVLDDIRYNYGNINGVIHCAGLAGDGLLYGKDKEIFDKVIGPKIYGTWILDNLTKDDELDFFVMFSSILSVFGDLGQSDYVAGNSYMDAFAALRSREGKRTLAINWPSWEETGMAVDYGVNSNESFVKSINTNRAINSLDQIINSKEIQILPGTLNYKRFKEKKDELGFKLSKNIEKLVNDVSLGEKKDINVEIESKLESSDVETILTKIWCKVLGIEELDIYDSFYSLGGDSLMGIELIKQINKIYPKMLDVIDIFTYPTVVQMANFIKKNLDISEISLKEKEVVEKDNSKELLNNLSNAQKRMYFLQKMEPNLKAYNLQIRVTNDNVDYNLLNETFNEVIARHDSLRTLFREEDGIPYQVVLDNLKYDIEFCDLSDKENGKEIMKQIMDEDGRVVFDLSKSLFIVKLYKLNEKDYWIYVNIHHIIVDGWSCGIIRDEVTEIYKAKKEKRKEKLSVVKKSYMDYVREIENWEKTKEAKEMKNYWIAELSNKLPVLNLPVDYVRPAVQTYNGSFVKIILSKENTAKLKKTAQRLNTTFHIFLLSAYYTLLNKLTEDNDIVVGVPMSGREIDDFENTVGLFINLVAVRINIDNKIRSFTDLLELVKKKSILAYKNSLYPFDLIISEANAVRDLSRSPIFSTTFQYYDHIPFDNDGISQYDISLMCRETHEELELRFEYNSDLFKRETVEWYGKYMENLLETICTESDILLEHIEYLNDNQKNEILGNYSGKTVDLQNTTIDKLFENCVIKNENNTALVFKNESITYKELNRKANRLANFLIEKENVQVGDTIGIIMGKGIETISAILAVIKAGAIYIPIEPNYPIWRISYMLSKSKARILLSEDKYEEKIKSVIKDCSIEVIINLENSTIRDYGLRGEYSLLDVIKCSEENPNIPNDYKNIMYIIYTSGSTGLPKGVMVSHENVANFINWSISENKISINDKIMHTTSISFDISVFEIFGALLSGAEVVIVPEDVIIDSYEMLNYLEDKKVTIWHSVPTLMAQVLMILRNTKENYKRVRNIPIIMIGGEAWNIEIANKIKNEFLKPKLINMYGPTETTIWVASYEINDDVKSLSSLPIGKPIWNNKVVILDENMKLCGVGMIGNIYICGKNVTPGYYEDNKKTKESFKLIDGEVYYNTNDRGRYLSDGNIAYEGRKDSMVKLRGYRIEIGEIESVILQNKEIKEAGVIVRKQGEAFKLVCFYTSEKEYNSEKLKSILQAKLPIYMVPSIFVNVKEMPHTLNGKIDRKSLENKQILEVESAQKEHIEATTDVEKELLKIWSKLLGLEKISLTDNFFSIGGDSFLVNRMYAEIEKLYPGKIKIVDIFTYTTITRLANYISNSENTVKEDEKIRNQLNKLFNDINDGKVDISEATKIMSDMVV
ncbi:amino acid adenylation domain-containing protein [Clostridium botulinum]|nr:amino acid adenylation domain-containing protein [Clostridium botulinum]